MVRRLMLAIDTAFILFSIVCLPWYGGHNCPEGKCHAGADLLRLTFPKTLCLMREHWYHYKRLIDSIYGVVFLGVPNFGKDYSQTTHTLRCMLECRESLRGNPTVSPQDVQDIKLLHEAFELLPVNFPVLCCFETLPTKLRKKTFAKFRKQEQYIVSAIASSDYASCH
jgi:hypothetical protein